MDNETAVRYLKYLIDMFERDQIRAGEIKKLTLEDILEFAGAEAEANLAKAENLINT